MNTEMMELYREHGINPVGGCLPVLAQAPVFLVLFQVIRGLTRRIQDAPFSDVVYKVYDVQGRAADAPDPNSFYPRYLDPTSEMFKDLIGEQEMTFLRVFDLGAQPNEILSESILKSIPYLIVIGFLVATSWYQQKQITARRSPGENGDESPVLAQQQAILKYLPFLTGIWAFFFPFGLSVYWATSNTFRIGQQAYITRAIYSKKDEMEASFQAELHERKKTKPAVEDTPAKQPSKGDGDTPAADVELSKVEQRRQRELERKKAIQAKARAKKKQADGATTSRTTPKGTKPSQQRRKKR
jgi:YidC/Oxa1 family membrane protein insertase